MTRFVRIPGPDGPRFGRVAGTHVEIIEPHPFGRHEATGERVSLEGLKLLAPVLPTKIVGVGRNYAAHADEMASRDVGTATNEDPLCFLVPASAVVGPGDAIRIPTSLTSEVHHEAELAVVIGSVLRDATPEQALEGILGFTCANDVTARDLQEADGQWWRAKGMDTFLPLGPAITTELDHTDVAISCRVNGESRQEDTTASMLHGVADLVSHISHAMTLLPTDVVLTGTPAGVGPIVDGDVVEVAIDGIGALVNPVVGSG